MDGLIVGWKCKDQNTALVCFWTAMNENNYFVSCLIPTCDESNLEKNLNTTWCDGMNWQSMAGRWEITAWCGQVGDDMVEIDIIQVATPIWAHRKTLRVALFSIHCYFHWQLLVVNKLTTSTEMKYSSFPWCHKPPISFSSKTSLILSSAKEWHSCCSVLHLNFKVPSTQKRKIN